MDAKNPHRANDEGSGVNLAVDNGSSNAPAPETLASGFFHELSLEAQKHSDAIGVLFDSIYDQLNELYPEEDNWRRERLGRVDVLTKLGRAETARLETLLESIEVGQLRSTRERAR